ncbi:FemAB family XrtA/PEP-CTERM system-associated protein [Sphingobium limneticum]|uniref:FemAB family PEP-CTERM system-associated protein n=1 Tax=Sphingobium limneticum TaxID=1007511 RepID=A0A5J5I8D1_9SPHN|nr:FemAB family XrtA/PEP-CTERM system-associated protein [Sphingobium limneticum]KAA9020706.1 FemAB family PEP-CTERM system-associated protein [Sphingobium limneticum]KAA9033032.1 FemAB family PEP-CTERM system-associated protein [Sphingobium limneticum]
MMIDHAADLAVVTLDVGDASQAQAADAFVASHAAGMPFHRTAWLRAITAATGHRAVLLAAVAPSGDIKGLLPLHHVKSRLFGNALVSTGFAVDGGLLVTDDRALAPLAAAAIQLARDKGAISVELRGGPAPGGEWSSAEGEYVGFVRPIAVDDEAELLAIPRKHRAELRKALANPSLSVEVGRTDRLLRDHYHVYATSVRNLGTPVFPAKLFKSVLQHFGDDADLLVVWQDDRPVSAVLSLYHQGRAMPYWGGGVADARQLRSNELMYYRLMGHGRARGMTHFDFGRSKAGSGQAAWKKSFGFEPVPRVYHDWAADGAGRDVNPHSAKYRRRVDLWKRLPLPVANLLGPMISRGLG